MLVCQQSEISLPAGNEIFYCVFCFEYDIIIKIWRVITCEDICVY